MAVYNCWKLARHEESLAGSEQALALYPRTMPTWTFKVETLLCLRHCKEAFADSLRKSSQLR